jgi:ClpP class serine protease
MKTLKSNQIEATEIREAMKEIEEKHNEFAQYVAQKNNWAIGDAIEAIATYIVVNDDDYVAE